MGPHFVLTACARKYGVFDKLESNLRDCFWG